MSLVLAQQQKQALSPQMVQSMELLQMASQELLEHLEAAAQENPVLELHETYDDSKQETDLHRKQEWLESTDFQNRSYHRQDSEHDVDFLNKYGAVEDYAETLYDHILTQLNGLSLPPETAACAKFLAGCLEKNGWLEEDLSSLARELGQSEEIMNRALAVVQSLDPAGVAARNLSECLCLQLLRRRPVDELAVRIAGEQLDALAKNHYGAIARALGASCGEVQRACGLIRSLEPRPGAKFAPYERPAYITPDIILVSLSGQTELLLNDRFLPTLNINSYYARLMKESGDDHVKDYLADKVNQAKWMIRAMEQRRKTLLACTECIVNAQEDFFRQGGQLKPLTLADVAEQVGVHESTVSRAINGKYLQCASGTYPLSHFFVRRLSAGTQGGELSSAAAKALLKRLIEQEDKRKPLSDQKLCERMAEQGCGLARRTVAKYREELGIPGTAGRKLFE